MNDKEIIDELCNVVEEFDCRENSHNVGMLLDYGWDDLCDYGIKLLQNLKSKMEE